MKKNRPLILAIAAFAILALVVGGPILAAKAQDYQSPSAAYCNLFNTPANFVLKEGAELAFYAQPLLDYTRSGKYGESETLTIVQAAYVEETCYLYVKPHNSLYSGWVVSTDLAEAEASHAAVSASSALGLTTAPSLGAAAGESGPDIIVVGEGTLVNGSAHVPYASLYSLFIGNDRNPTIYLCVADAGCDINGRGDTRYYTMRDGSKVELDVLLGWIHTQIEGNEGFEAFVTMVVTNGKTGGEIVAWPSASGG